MCPLRAGALAQARMSSSAATACRPLAGTERFGCWRPASAWATTLATWHAWRQDPARCERLVFVSVEKHPLRREDLSGRIASALQDLAAQLLTAGRR